MENKFKTGIQGVELLPLEIIDAKGGPVLRMLRPGSAILPSFPNGIGEIYFSEVLPGEIKAWKMHKSQNQLFAVPMGEIRIAMYDMRADSPTLRVVDATTLGRPGNYNLLRVPAGVWYGFKCVSETSALICNCPDVPHDPADCERAPHDTPDIPYFWK